MANEGRCWQRELGCRAEGGVERLTLFGTPPHGIDATVGDGSRPIQKRLRAPNEGVETSPQTRAILARLLGATPLV